MAFYFAVIEQLIVIIILLFYFSFPVFLPEILEVFSGLPESQETISIHRYLMKERGRQILPQKNHKYENESNYKLLLTNNN